VSHPDPLDHELLVVFKSSSTLGWLSPTDLDARAALELPKHAHELLVDTARARAYVSIYGDGIYGNNTHAGNQLAVIDLDDRSLITLVDLGENRGAHGLAFDANDNVMVTCDRTATVVTVDRETLTVVDDVKLSAWATPHWIVSHPDLGKAYTSNKATPYVSVLDTRSREVIGQIPTPTGSEGVALSSNGSRLYIADHGGSGLPSSVTKQPVMHVVDTANDEISETIPLALAPLDYDVDHELRVIVAPDDKHVILSAHAWDRVLIVDTAQLSRQRLITLDGGPMGATFEPGYGSRHRHCVVTSHDIGQIVRIDVDDAAVIDRRTPLDIAHQGPEILEFIARR
jgi:DNA-binding beta-propeller fold protein YncE